MAKNEPNRDELLARLEGDLIPRIRATFDQPRTFGPVAHMGRLAGAIAHVCEQLEGLIEYAPHDE